MWSPSIQGQPIYDAINNRGKIICCNQQTADFWVKYIALASTMVGNIKLKAWTNKEYECKNAIYSCLIPKNSVIGIYVEDIIKACLNLYGIKNSQGVVRCHTSHTMREYQQICHDWLEYASHNTTHLEIFVTPKKDAINQTIMKFLENKWSAKWENLKGHAQTKFWCTGPDPILSAKLLNMPRQHLGWCIQFFTGHGWWKKHLKLANLCNDHTCRLCKRYDSIESPIHFFSECTALTAIRQEIFNTPYPTTHTNSTSTTYTNTHTNSTQLCQVAEFALVGRVCDLIDIDNYHVNVNSSR